MRPFLLLFLVGCGSNLPEGWEGAEPVSSLEQTACKGDASDELDERILGELEADLNVSAYEVLFRCDQEVQGFYLEEGGEVRVLLQPVKMKPGSVPKCDCPYDFEIGVSLSSAPTSVEVFRRYDEHAGKTEPVLIGTLPEDSVNR